MIIPSVQRTCLPGSGVGFAAGGELGERWDEVGELCNAATAVRAVVLLSLPLFGVNNVSGLLPWQGEGCSHFHVFYK